MICRGRKGPTAIPKAFLIVLAGRLYGLTLSAVAVILGVDSIMDMARTATKVIGNCLATVVIA